LFDNKQIDEDHTEENGDKFIERCKIKFITTVIITTDGNHHKKDQNGCPESSWTGEDLVFVGDLFKVIV